MMISHYTMITLWRFSITSFVTMRINICLFNHLFLVFFLDFLEHDAVSFPFTWCILGCCTSKYFFLICFRDFLVLGNNGMSFRPLSVINTMFSKCGEQSTHSTVAFSFVDIFFWESIAPFMCYYFLERLHFNFPSWNPDSVFIFLDVSCSLGGSLYDTADSAKKCGGFLCADSASVST